MSLPDHGLDHSDYVGARAHRARCGENIGRPVPRRPTMRRHVPTAKTTLPRQRRPQGANDINATTGLTELRLDDDAPPRWRSGRQSWANPWSVLAFPSPPETSDR